MALMRAATSAAFLAAALTGSLALDASDATGAAAPAVDAAAAAVVVVVVVAVDVAAADVAEGAAPVSFLPSPDTIRLSNSRSSSSDSSMSSPP